MKRELDDNDPTLDILKTKRPRLGQEVSSLFDDESLIRYPSDLLENGTDGTGYIDVLVRMSWEKSTMLCTRVKVTEPSGKDAMFDIHFLKPCFDEFTLACSDTFKLALRGCEIRHAQSSSAPSSVPIVLRYSKPALFKFSLLGKKEVPEEKCLMEVGKEEPTSVKLEDWFSTPAPDNMPMHNAIPPPLRQAPAPTVHTHTVPLVQQKAASPTAPSPPAQPVDVKPVISPVQEKQPPVENIPQSAVQVDNSGQSHASTKLSKRAKKTKRAKEKLRASMASTPAPEQIAKIAPTPPPEQVVGAVQTLISEGNAAVVPVLVPEPIAAPPPRSDEDEADLDSTPSCSHSSALKELNASLNAIIGYANPKEQYVPIADVLSPDFKRTQNFNFIGVVRDVGAVFTTKKSQWKKFIRVVDESNKDDIVPEQEGLRVNCFVKRSEEFLPSPEKGDIVIFRHLSLSTWNDLKEATGPSDLFQWLIFSPGSGTFKHNGDEMDSRALHYSPGLPEPPMPFWRPNDSQLSPLSTYCVKLADWWAGVQQQREKATSNATIHYLGSDDTSSTSQRRRAYPSRQHRLLRDCTPDMQPNGYFNCTLEIRRVREYSGSGPLTVLATDYTRPKYPVHEDPVCDLSWCPGSLRPYLFSLDIWNDAIDQAKDMKPGEIYRFTNVKFGPSKFRYWQGSLREPKLRRLEETDENKDDEFGGFLKRKEEWEKKHGGAARHGLLSEIRSGGVLSCTVQLLHRERARTSTELFVTDFTASDEFCPSPTEAPWASRLDKKIFKIFCRHGIERQAEALEIGSYCLLKNIVIRKSNITDKLYGELGGEEELISVANESAPHTTALVARKEEWKKSSSKEAESSRLKNCISIDELRAKKELGSHQTVSKVVGYYPFEIEDAVTAFCGQCDTKLTPIQRTCPQCQEDDHIEHYFYFAIEIEDRAGTRLKLILGTPSTTVHPLHGLKPCNLRDNPESLTLFKNRILPLVGEIPEARAKKIPLDRITTPFLKMTIDCRPKPGSDKMVYALRCYEELQ